MEKSAFISATYFTIYSMFLFYQQSFTKNFQGSSQVFLLTVNLFAFGGFAAQIIFFIYYGWNVSWLDAVLITVASIFIGSMIGVLLEKAIGGLLLVFIGFLAIPYCGYKMFKSIPISAVT